MRAAILFAIPWVLVPAVAMLRSLRSRFLHDYPAAEGPDLPLVSVIVPARNERRNIERCVRSILGSSYPRLEVIVVDDHSTDGTGDMARAVGAGDPRLRVIANPDLPGGWFGKQWACWNGARHARGDLLLFTDADTWHAPDLLGRSVAAMRNRSADLFTVGGAQETHTFWERVIQPQVFSMINVRYGGTEEISRTRRPENVIANGQYLLFTREAYDAVGGHEGVKDTVAEDLMLAQRVVAAGLRLFMLFARTELSTHMYAGLREAIAGWGKNVYAGGRHASVPGAAGRLAYPVVLVSVPLVALAPPLALILGAVGVLPPAWAVWGGIGVAAALTYFAAVNRFMQVPLPYTFLYPLGAAVLLRIIVGAVWRGSRVTWKGRQYVSR